MKKFYLVTGGTGFIGSAIVRRMVMEGYKVRVMDNNSRGTFRRLHDIKSDFEFIEADIRDLGNVSRAAKGVEGILHLAYVNGTEFFYKRPQLVLDVGVRGMLNVLDSCLTNHIGELILASSSEVYQTPDVIPTPENVPLTVPDPFNPRYSYGGGKLISELLTINYARENFQRAMIFRPHNVIGPDMGWEHVLPQFVLRMKRLCKEKDGRIQFPIQGDGSETRAFIDIDDFVDGIMLMMEKGEHMNIYHIGTENEVQIREAALAVAGYFNREIELIPGESPAGGTRRRCPDITKMKQLGFSPTKDFHETINKLAEWYDKNSILAEKTE